MGHKVFTVVLVGLALVMLWFSISFLRGTLPQAPSFETIREELKPYDPAATQAYHQLNSMAGAHQKDQQLFLEDIRRIDTLREYIRNVHELQFYVLRVEEAREGYGQNDSARNYATLDMAIEKERWYRDFLSEEAGKVGVRDSTVANTEIAQVQQRMQQRRGPYFQRIRDYDQLLYRFDQRFLSADQLPPGETEVLPRHLYEVGDEEQGWDHVIISKFNIY